jgi:dienelactone hydrolase
LSLQLPLTSDQPNAQEYLDLFSEARARINTGIKFFRDKGIFNIVLVGHSLGGAMGLNYLIKEPTRDSKVIAFVGIAMYDTVNLDKSLSTDKLMGKLNLPVLDIFGNLDRRIVLNDAAARAQQAKNANMTHYRQIELAGADHVFTALENDLVKRIRFWLNKQARGMEINSETFVPDGKKPNNVTQDSSANP